MTSNKVPFTAYPNSLEFWQEKSKDLWFEGNLELFKLPMASIIGTRKISQEGIIRTKKITEIFVKNGFCIVSGLALGVDTIAHQTTLALDGNTIAVMGTPINKTYPLKNAYLKKEIINKGLVLSQFPPGSTTQRFNFPKRNDLMAVLSRITIVIEAGETSGTRHQVTSALKYGRTVAFLKSLAKLNIKWINTALKDRNSLIISNESDLVNFIKGKINCPPKTIDQLELFN